MYTACVQPTDMCHNTILVLCNQIITGAAERSKAVDFSRVGTRQFTQFPPKYVWLLLTGNDQNIHTADTCWAGVSARERSGAHGHQVRELAGTLFFCVCAYT
jgi:hypothetical protein